MRMLLITLLILLAAPVMADDLTRMVQQELQGLGYDVDRTDGEQTVKTAVAISQFQADQGMEITGEATPQLVGALRAAADPGASPAPDANAAVMAAADREAQQADLEARRQACLQDKMAAAEEANRKKSGFKSLLSAVSRASNQFGGGSLAGEISRVSLEVYDATATAEEMSTAARDLGLTEDEMEACRDP